MRKYDSSVNKQQARKKKFSSKKGHTLEFAVLEMTKVYSNKLMHLKQYCSKDLIRTAGKSEGIV